MLQLTNFSLTTLGKIEELLNSFKHQSLKYKKLVEINFGVGETLISVRYLNNAGFYFNVSKPVAEGASITKKLEINYKPQSISTIASGKFLTEFKDIPEIFENWVNIIKTYDKIDLNKYCGDFEKVFEDEVYDDFEILDEDASYMPYDSPRIEFLYKYLSYVELVIKKEAEQGNPEIQELLIGVTDLKENLDNKTKAEVVSQYSKLTAKAKKIGTKVGLAFWDVAKKEGIKYILNMGYDKLHNIRYSITEFMNGLPPIHPFP